MTKSINTLIGDIQELLRNERWFNHELEQQSAAMVADRLRSAYGVDQGERRSTLRLSRMGPICPKALWYSIHKPEMAEPLPPAAKFKYTYGHLIEALVISLAKASGHEVTGEQDELRVDGIVGHRDCVIDGCTVDVKSASSISFQKFRQGTIKENDSFGYLDQLDGYVIGASEDPLVTVKDRGYLLAVDKQLGHMVTYEHIVTDERRAILKARIVEYKRVVALPTPPVCTCGHKTEANGNIRLDTRASYSAFKYCCNPTLRVFKYANGPAFYTKVVKLPNVPEMHPKHLTNLQSPAKMGTDHETVH